MRVTKPYLLEILLVMSFLYVFVDDVDVSVAVRSVLFVKNSHYVRNLVKNFTFLEWKTHTTLEMNTTDIFVYTITIFGK